MEWEYIEKGREGVGGGALPKKKRKGKEESSGRKDCTPFVRKRGFLRQRRRAAAGNPDEGKDRRQKREPTNGKKEKEKA